MRARTLAALALPILGLAACASTSDVKIAVTGTDDACIAADDALDAGKTTFVFENKAKDLSELYVLRDDDSVVAEVENVPTGQKRNLNVDLSAGSYFLNCKPGQKGEGFRTSFTVTGEGGAQPPTGGREVVIDAKDYAFDPATVTASSGETVTLELKNEGTVEHELEVFDPSGKAIGEVGPTKPGAEGKVTITLTETGSYRLVCGIEDHEARGMVGTLTVS
ncbi:MAG TPA: cupredoxin domain-containing protein [Acidimicrobiales bacterium]